MGDYSQSRLGKLDGDYMVNFPSPGSELTGKRKGELLPSFLFHITHCAPSLSAGLLTIKPPKIEFARKLFFAMSQNFFSVSNWDVKQIKLKIAVICASFWPQPQTRIPRNISLDQEKIISSPLN